MSELTIAVIIFFWNFYLVPLLLDSNLIARSFDRRKKSLKEYFLPYRVQPLL
jgi:hypothetical protein